VNPRRSGECRSKIQNIFNIPSNGYVKEINDLINFISSDPKYSSKKKMKKKSSLVELNTKKDTDSVQLFFDFMTKLLKSAHDVAVQKVSNYSSNMNNKMHKKSNLASQCDVLKQKIKRFETRRKQLSDTERLKNTLKQTERAILKTQRLYCEAEIEYKEYSDIKCTIEYLILELNKLHKSYLNRPVTCTNKRIEITNQNIYFLVPEDDDDNIIKNAKNAEHLFEAFRGHYNIVFQYIFFSHNEKEFESRISMLNEERLHVSTFVSFGHGGEQKVGPLHGHGIDRHRFAEIIDTRSRDFNKPTFLATECRGNLHKRNYKNIAVTPVVNNKYSLAIAFNNHNLSLMLHVFKKYIQDYYL
jgi:hypothetical protein